MALNDTILNIGNAAMQSAMTHASIHSAADTESTAARQAITWDTAANGDMVITTALNFTGGASGGAATRVGFYSAVSAGTYYGEQALTGDQTFNAAGEYTVTGVTITGSAS
jgi:hypothetical protein